jgi:predicted ATPase
MAFLSRAPGVAQTRLLEQFPPPEYGDECTVLRGGASQAEGMPPHVPFLEALGDYFLTAQADQLRVDVGAHANVLATLFPEITARLGSLPPQFPLAPEQERFRLYRAVATLLSTIASRTRGVLLLDDLQWADPASCDLLVHVATRLRGTPAFLIGAYREDEAS